MLKELAVDFLTETFLGILAPVDVQVVHYELDCPTLQSSMSAEYVQTTISQQQHKQQQQVQQIHY